MCILQTIRQGEQDVVHRYTDIYRLILEGHEGIFVMTVLLSLDGENTIEYSIKNNDLKIITGVFVRINYIAW